MSPRRDREIQYEDIPSRPARGGRGQRRYVAALKLLSRTGHP